MQHHAYNIYKFLIINFDKNLIGIYWIFVLRFDQNLLTYRTMDFLNSLRRKLIYRGEIDYQTFFLKSSTTTGGVITEGVSSWRQVSEVFQKKYPFNFSSKYVKRTAIQKIMSQETLCRLLNWLRTM